MSRDALSKTYISELPLHLLTKTFPTLKSRTCSCYQRIVI